MTTIERVCDLRSKKTTFEYIVKIVFAELIVKGWAPTSAHEILCEAMFESFGHSAKHVNHLLEK